MISFLTELILSLETYLELFRKICVKTFFFLSSHTVPACLKMPKNAAQAERAYIRDALPTHTCTSNCVCCKIVVLLFRLVSLACSSFFNFPPISMATVGTLLTSCLCTMCTERTMLTLLRYCLQWNPSIGTAYSVLIKRGVLILGVVLYTFLCNWDHAWCPD